LVIDTYSAFDHDIHIYHDIYALQSCHDDSYFHNLHAWRMHWTQNNAYNYVSAKYDLHVSSVENKLKLHIEIISQTNQQINNIDIV